MHHANRGAIVRFARRENGMGLVSQSKAVALRIRHSFLRVQQFIHRLLLQHAYSYRGEDSCVGCIGDLDSLSTDCIQGVADERHAVILAAEGVASRTGRVATRHINLSAVAGNDVAKCVQGCHG